MREVVVEPWAVRIRALSPAPCRSCGWEARLADRQGPICGVCVILAPSGAFSFRDPAATGLVPREYHAVRARWAAVRGPRVGLREQAWLAFRALAEVVPDGARRARLLAAWLQAPLLGDGLPRGGGATEAEAFWGYEAAVRTGIVPVGRTGVRLEVALARWPEDGLDEFLLKVLEGSDVEVVAVSVARDDDARQLADRAYGREVVAIEPMSVRSEVRPVDVGVEVLTADEKERLLREFRAGREGLRLLLILATEAGATDIHIEPRGDATFVRFRSGGELRVAARLGREDWRLMANAVRASAGISAEAAVEEQRGALTVVLDDRRIDVRVSVVPVVVPGSRDMAEKVVLRLLDQNVVNRGPAEIGLVGPAWRLLLGALRMAVPKHPGLIVLSGATGSGKTTTLHALLRLLPLDSINAVGIEDPVEIFTPGLTQCGVSPRFGFAAAIRAFLRQDPDVMLVGEVRDPETARAVYEAALTGHTVLTTVHADSAPDVFVRIAELVGERALLRLAALVRLVSYQQMRRRPCGECAVRAEVALPGGRTVQGRAGSGCGRCRGGYSGVIPIFETLALDTALVESARRAVRRERLSFAEALRRVAAEAGTYVPLEEDAAWKAERGLLDVRELEAVARGRAVVTSGV